MSSSKKQDKSRSRRREKPQRVAQRAPPPEPKGFWSGMANEMADLLIGPDVPPYGFLLASLDEGDKKYLNQLRQVANVTPNPKAIFHLLTTTEYVKSNIPLASDDNPFGEVAGTGVGLIVPDGLWGPDLLEDSTEEENYWQLIDAAQEMAINVVFIFIKHKDSKGQQGICHQKFERLAEGPWPKKLPHVFLMSFWERFSEQQIEVIKSCLTIHDPLQIKLEITKNLRKHQDVKDEQVAKPTPSSATAPATEGDGLEKGKEKLDEGNKSSSTDSLVEFKRQLLWDNEKQFAAFRGELKELKEQVARLTAALAAKEGKPAGEKTTLLG